MNQSFKKKFLFFLSLFLFFSVLGISFFVLPEKAEAAVPQGRVVGRVLDNALRRWQNPAKRDCGSEWQSSSQLGVSPEGGWGCNYDPLIGTSNTPYYYTSSFNVGTHTITLTPPSGYQCDVWHLGYYPDEITAQGSGCSATILVKEGDWATHLWFYIKRIPSPPPSPSSPVVDIKANDSDGPITIDYNSSATLSWTSSNATSCTASNGWSGTKSFSGSESTGNLTFSKTYTLSCSGPGGTTSDSVTVNVSSQPTLSVILEAIPNSGLAPLNNVDLKATVSGTATGSINYKFDCQNDGIWDYTFNNIWDNPKMVYSACNYQSPGTYLAKVYVERGSASPVQATTQIVVFPSFPALNISKSVRNITDNTGFQESVSADPSERLEFSIQVNSIGNTTVQNVIVSDVLPSRIIYQGNLKIDGILVSGDVISGKNIGNLSPGQSKTVTFEARVASEGEFGSGLTTNLVNTARSWADGVSQIEDTVVVNVYRPSLISPAATFSVSKLVRNLSDNTGWLDSVAADPDEIVSFSIQITATGTSPAKNIIVKDTLPVEVAYQGNLKIDGLSSNNNIISGFSIGDLYSGQSRTITFEAKVASEDQFNYGTTNLINTAMAYNVDAALTDPAKIVVSKKAVAGAVTEVKTGIINRALDYLLIPLIMTLIMILVFKNYFIFLNKWLEKRKSEIIDYRARRALKKVISRIRIQEKLL